MWSMASEVIKFTLIGLVYVMSHIWARYYGVGMLHGPLP